MFVFKHLPMELIHVIIEYTGKMHYSFREKKWIHKINKDDIRYKMLKKLFSRQFRYTYEEYDDHVYPIIYISEIIEDENSPIEWFQMIKILDCDEDGYPYNPTHYIETQSAYRLVLQKRRRIIWSSKKN